MERDKRPLSRRKNTQILSPPPPTAASSQIFSRVDRFFINFGVSGDVPETCNAKDFHSDLIRGLLVKVDVIRRGRISCLLSVKPAVANIYGGFHGGAVASVAEMVSNACARTVVGKDKELFLGELSTSYLSAAPRNAELKVDASVVRSGRNLTVIAVEFKVKDSEKLVYTSRATFYNMPVASL
ncbi:Esterase [Actinidia chinensis var. chinensis]|uniref:Esterase n=1 Tax=Actinidia chinensis var. chinensis TaxID=1590841 RepID=A0A2R6QP63_ACTCC|nr:Esterase [Actinidia chinensis var. chinensis]